MENTYPNDKDKELERIARLPTKELRSSAESETLKTLTDEDFMRIAVLLAQKSYDEGGCPIGAVIVENDSRMIVGKGHNTLVQDGDPYNHGETAALRDAGRIDFSKTTIFTSLSPCDICAALIVSRGFRRVVVGDVTNAFGNEEKLREKGIKADILEDRLGVGLYAKYREEKPELDLEDWKGVAALKK